VRISANIAALTTRRVLERSDRAVFRSLERLSSGARINSASDDAGGLSVSEGLRSRSAGMRQAVRNTRDGIDLVRTAESALAETASVLQRMRDLSVQAANDGALDAPAKDTIQRELDQLSGQLTRIATTTTYNGTPLLDGSYAGTFQVGPEAGETITVAIGAPGRGLDAAALGVDGIDVLAAAGPRAVTGVMSAGGGVTVQVTPALSAAEGGPAAGSIALAGNFGAVTTFTGLAGTISYDGGTLDLATVDYTGAVTANDHLRELEKAIDDCIRYREEGRGRQVGWNGDHRRNAGQRVDRRGRAAAHPDLLGSADTADTAQPADAAHHPDAAGGGLRRPTAHHRRGDPADQDDPGGPGRHREPAGAHRRPTGRGVRGHDGGVLPDPDTDMAMEMTGLSRNQVLVQAGRDTRPGQPDTARRPPAADLTAGHLSGKWTLAYCSAVGDVFKALADPTRRAILDELQERNGQTLFELCTRLISKHGSSSSRQAVSQHLDVLEAAGLVRTRREGRYKFHDLDTSPLRTITERWHLPSD
jgi:flagellin-like hook-associated protein FlgL/DNA-binding transcriptional ArsR family regulator